jgi:DNA repair exonuclease SbcCD ATPase subunit
VNSVDHAKELRQEKEKFLKMRAKLRDYETSLANAEKKLQQAQENVKRLESQMKQKDTNIECKVKELAKCQKNYENAIGKSDKQREILETRSFACFILRYSS